jgi:sulfoquinovosyltransferase
MRFFSFVLAVVAFTSTAAFRLLQKFSSATWIGAKRTPVSDSKTAGTKTILKKPLKLLCVVEPSPFTYVSGYANRFQEMLKCFNKTGDEGNLILCSEILLNYCSYSVHIIVPDNSKSPPTEYMGFPVTTIPGYSLIWYKAVTLSFGNKQIGQVIENFKPDVIHVTTPGTLVFRTAYAARKYKIPLVMSYHTHLPAYAKRYFPVPGSVALANNLVKWMHNIADLTLATSPELKKELEKIGVKRVAVWEKGVNTQVLPA